MSKLMALIRAYLPQLKSQKDWEEAYLNEAVDIYDLERRMSNVNRRGTACGAYPVMVGMGGR